MNKNLRKRKIKTFMKISMRVSKIPGSDWQDYIDKVKKSFDYWNWDSYKIEIQYYGSDVTSEKKRSINEDALDQIRVEYTEFYSMKNGLKHSDIDYPELEKLSFEDYKKWYSSLLDKNGVKAISPAKALVELRKEMDEYSDIIFVEPDIVKNYKLKNIDFNINCGDYRRALAQEYDILSFESFKNILNAGQSSWPMMAYICYEDILYKVESVNDIDPELSKYGKIQASVDIPFDNNMILNYLSNNSEIILEDEEGIEDYFDLSDPEDFAFIRTWIPYGKGRRMYLPAGMNPYSVNPIEWLRSEIRNGIRDKTETIRVGGHLGVGKEEVFDLSKNYDGEGPVLYFKKGSGDMVIMSEEKNNAHFWAELSKDISKTSEILDVGFGVAGFISPHAALISLFFAAAEYISALSYTSNLEKINKIDISNLEEHERNFLEKKYDLKKEIQKAKEADEKARAEHGITETLLSAISAALDIWDEQIANFTVAKFASIGPASRVAYGAQAISVLISGWDVYDSQDIEKTKEMKSNDSKAKIIVNKLR